MTYWLLLGLTLGCGAKSTGLDTATDSDTDTFSDTDTDVVGCVDGADIQSTLNAGTLSIVVCAGDHQVNLTVPDGAVIEGSGVAADTTLDGSGTGATVHIATGATVTLRNLTITNGVDMDFAGGIRGTDAEQLTVEGCIIENNTGYVGGLYGPSLSGSTVLTDTIVRANSGTLVGGVAVSQATLTGVTIEDNTGTDALSAGGMFVFGLPDWQGDVFADSTTVVQRNNGSAYGGGVLLDQYTRWTGGVVRENSAVAGGGLALLNANNIALSDVTIADNTATAGAGLWANGTSSGDRTVTVDNMTFTANASDGDGGAIDWDVDATLSMTDTTLSGNTAVRGAGIHAAAGTVSLTNAEVTANVASSAGGGVLLESNGMLTVTNSDFGTDATDNDPDDVSIPGQGDWAAYGAGASFSCNAVTGTCQ